MQRRFVVAIAASVVAACAGAFVTDVLADDKDGGAPKKPPAASTPASTAPSGGIQWFSTWEQGRREAKRTGRPILLVAAAPQCHDVSGLW